MLWWSTATHLRYRCREPEAILPAVVSDVKFSYAVSSFHSDSSFDGRSQLMRRGEAKVFYHNGRFSFQIFSQIALREGVMEAKGIRRHGRGEMTNWMNKVWITPWRSEWIFAQSSTRISSWSLRNAPSGQIVSSLAPWVPSAWIRFKNLKRVTSSGSY